MTAGSDIGLLGRGKESKEWRIWSIEEENRRATVPYNMDKDEETIVVGMQLDFTATKKLEKPLYPDEDPAECDPLPILWVLNTLGQLAGWTVMYIPGIKTGERPVSMMPAEWQNQYWQKEREARLRGAEDVDKEEQHDRDPLEKEGQERGKNAINESAPTFAQQTSQMSIQPPRESVETPIQTPLKPTPVTTLPAPSTPIANTTEASHPTFGKPSPPGAPTFGQMGQLGGSLPGQSSMYGSSRPTHAFGQSSGLGGFNSSPSGGMAGGFANFSSQSTQGSSLLAGQTGSFLQNSKGGSFLQGGQTSSFLQGVQESPFAKYSSARGFGAPQSLTTPSSFSDAGFLADAKSPSPSSTSLNNSFGPSTQSQTILSSGMRGRDTLDDSQTDSEELSVDQSGSDDNDNVRVDALSFGDDGFKLDLGTKADTVIEQPVPPVKKNSSREGPSQTTISPQGKSPSSAGDSEYVNVSIPITPSPRSEKFTSYPPEISDLTPSGRDESHATETYPIPVALPMNEQKPLTAMKIPPVFTAKHTVPRVNEIANTPQDPFTSQIPPKKATTLPASFPAPYKASVQSAKESIARMFNQSRNKMEPRHFVPVSETIGISLQQSDSAV